LGRIDPELARVASRDVPVLIDGAFEDLVPERHVLKRIRMIRKSTQSSAADGRHDQHRVMQTLMQIGLKSASNGEPR